MCTECVKMASSNSVVTTVGHSNAAWRTPVAYTRVPLLAKCAEFTWQPPQYVLLLALAFAVVTLKMLPAR